MNYLGHAYLSFGDAELLTGNMIGDHVKGLLALDAYPERIKEGVMLHRKIDAFADTHPATLRGKLLFKEDYGLYAGAIMDTLYDHFLANDPKIFSSDSALLAFSESVYLQLGANERFFPGRFAEYFPYMKQYNWLYNYRTLKGIERSLEGLARRAKHIPSVERAYQIFVINYYTLNQCYFEIIDDIVKHVKAQTSNP